MHKKEGQAGEPDYPSFSRHLSPEIAVLAGRGTFLRARGIVAIRVRRRKEIVRRLFAAMIDSDRLRVAVIGAREEEVESAGIAVRCYL